MNRGVLGCEVVAKRVKPASDRLSQLRGPAESVILYDLVHLFKEIETLVPCAGGAECPYVTGQRVLVSYEDEGLFPATISPYKLPQYIKRGRVIGVETEEPNTGYIGVLLDEDARISTPHIAILPTHHFMPDPLSAEDLKPPVRKKGREDRSYSELHDAPIEDVHNWTDKELFTYIYSNEMFVTPGLTHEEYVSKVIGMKKAQKKAQSRTPRSW